MLPINGHITISEGSPTGNFAGENLLWFNPSDGKLRYLKDDIWTEMPVPLEITMDEELAAALVGKADVSHEHPNHGDINFTGTVSAGGTEGLTGERTLGGYKITFKKGLLVGFQQV